MIVQMAGLPGTGKSTLAAALTARLDGHPLLLDKDQVRHSVFGPRHTHYSRAQDDLCVEIMHRAAAWHLDHNDVAMVILDGRTCSRAYQLADTRRLARTHRVPLRVIECVCPDELARARLAADARAGAHPAANRHPGLHHRLKTTAAPIPAPKLRIDTSAPLAHCVQTCLAYLRRSDPAPGAPDPTPTGAPPLMPLDLAHLHGVALAALDLAAAHVRRPPRAIAAKGERDVVTDVDRAVETEVRAFLAEATPSLGFFGEEHGGHDDGIRWVLDPVDGTANHLRGLPLHAVALALVDHGRPVVAAVDLPALGRRYSAADGHGARCDGEPISAAATVALADAIVAIGDYGTGPDAPARDRTAHALHEHLAPRAGRVRMLGSAAVDLVWVADGTLDGSITLGNRIWDTAAGILIAREADAHVSDVHGARHHAASTSTVVSAPGLRDELLTTIRAAAHTAARC